MTTLHHHRVHAPGASPERWMFLLHGIYGAGRNWNRVARDVVAARPDWGVIPLDLRGHGRSEPGVPPHTLDACVDDLLRLRDALGHPVDAVLGHSFGGKVALLLGDRPEAGISSVVVIDSTPDARAPEGSAWGMLRVLRGAPGPFADREAGIAAVEGFGYDRPVAQWMGTNLEPAPGGNGLRWRLDAAQMEALLRAFFARDAWPVLEAAVGPEIHMVRATRSRILTPAAIERIEHAGAVTGRVRLHEIEGGHWLNADNPAAVTALVAEVLPG